MLPAPSRIRSLMLAFALIVPSLVVLGPVVDAQATACVGNIEAVLDTQPSLWVNHGDTVVLKVFVSGQNGAVAQLQGTVTVHVEVTFQGGTSPDITRDVPFSPGTTRDIDIALPANAKAGFARVDLKEGAVSGGCVWADGGTGTNDKKWGFWVDEKPDVFVPKDGISLIRHDSTNDAADTHATLGAMAAGENFTRYPDVTGTCNEQRTGASAGLPPRYSHAHFEITVGNNGSADFSPPAPIAAPTGTESTGLNITIKVLDNGRLVGQTLVQLYGPIAPGKTTNVTFPAVWSLVDNAGPHDIQVVLDPEHAVPQTDTSNDATTQTIRIEGPQLTVTFSSMGLTQDHHVKGKVTIKNIGRKPAGVTPSQGDDTLICMSRTGGAFSARAYLDKVDVQHLLHFDTAAADFNITTSLDPGKDTGQVNFDASAGPIVAAGNHTIIVMANDKIDPANINSNSYLTEFNGTHAFTDTTCCNLPDTVTPTLRNVTVCTPAGCGASVTGSAGAAVNISGDVLDDSDFSSSADSVNLDVTYPNGTTQTFTVVQKPPASALNLRSASNGTLDVQWWFNSTYRDEGTYTVKVRAVDGAGHEGLFPQVGALGFTLQTLPKTMQMYAFSVCDEAAGTEGSNASALQDCVGPDVNVTGSIAGKNFTTDSGATCGSPPCPMDGFKLWFRVPPGATGLLNATHNASRMSLQVTDPDGKTLGNYTVTPLCYYTAANPSTPGAQPGPDNCPAGSTTVAETCAPDPTTNVSPAICYNSYYGLTFSPNVPLDDRVFTNPATCAYVNQTKNPTLFEPSLWNLTLWVGDAACKFKAWDLNNMPQWVDNVGNTTGVRAAMQFWLFDTVPGTIANATQAGGSGSSVNAKQQDLVFRADLSDNIKVKQGFAQLFARPAGGNESLLLQQNMTATRYWNTTTRNGTYAVSIPTGLGSQVCNAGTYHWRIGMMDANHTLTFTDGNVTVNDVLTPSVANESAMHGASSTSDTAFQVLENVTIRASATDDTCFTLSAVLQDGTGRELFRRAMAPEPGAAGAYRSLNITTGPGNDLPEGTYGFFVEAVDSSGKRFDSATHPIVVAGDLPPSFTNVVPSDGGFGKPDQEVGLDANDLVQGVNVANISASFAVNDGALQPVNASDLRTQVTAGSAALATTVHIGFTIHASAGDKVTWSVNASDNGGKVQAKRFTYTVDATPPVTTLACTQSYPKPCGSEGTQAVAKATTFFLNATDADGSGKPVAGVASISYAVEVLGQLQPAVVVPGGSASFSLFDLVGGVDGYYVLHYSALDNAGNREVEHRLTFALDTRGPAVLNAVTTPVPQGVNLTVSISDALPDDVQSATLYYRNGQSEFRSAPLVRAAGTNLWSGTLPGAQRGVQVCYYISARDFLGNVATNGTEVSPICFTSENHAPSLTVLSPPDGSQVEGSFEVRWQVSDIDNDPVTVRISYRLKSAVEFIPVPISQEEQGARRKVIDASQLVSGDYLLRVEASDNQLFNNRTRVDLSFTVGNGTLLGRPSFPTDVAPGQAIKVTVQVGKPVDSIEARLLKDGNAVARQAMEQDPPGTRTYTATFHVSDPGTYEVEVRGTFSDGTPFVVRGASPIRVAGAGFLNVGSPETLLILAVGVAVIGLAGAGLRRRVM